MLLADEVAAIRRYEARASRAWVLLTVLALVAALVPPLVYLPGEGRLDHLLGRDRPVVAEVESVQVDGFCRRRAIDHYQVEVSWTIDGSPGRGSYSLCREAPREGERTRVWIGPSGHMEPNSPRHDRLGLALVSLSVGALVVVLGAVMIVPPRHRRRRLLATGGRGLAPGVPVELRRAGRGRLRMRQIAPVPMVSDPMSAAPTAPTVAALDRGVVAEVAIHSLPGLPPTARARGEMPGTWWFHVAPSVGSRRKTGLLVRGHERCWIEFTDRRR